MPTVTPFQTEIESVELISFDGVHSIDLGGQIYSISLFENIFSPLQSATIKLIDSIGILNNFPLIGEELVVITLRKRFADKTPSITEGFGFVIDSVTQLQPDVNGRAITYQLNLQSMTTILNSIQNVQAAYNGTVSEIIEKLFNDYIHGPIEYLKHKSPGFANAIAKSKPSFYTIAEVEDSYGSDAGTITIPNMRPLSAIQWLASLAVPQAADAVATQSYNYQFWQANDGFHFQTIQDLYRTRPPRNQYVFYANDHLAENNNLQRNAIQNIKFNSRITTTNKIVAGYIDNTLFEVNLAQNRYKINNTNIADFVTNIETGGPTNPAVRPGRVASDSAARSTNNRKTNTDQFLEAIGEYPELSQQSIESSNRVRYVFNNRLDHDPVTPLFNSEQNWGHKVRAATALAQVDLYIAVQGDSSIAAGDTIEIDIPKFEGFNQNSSTDNREDQLISGKYLVSEVKNLFVSAAGVHSTVLRINKDSYSSDPAVLPHRYSL